MRDDLQKFGNVEGPSESGIPFVQVKERRIDGWFADAGKSAGRIAAGIDKDLKPESFAFPASLRVNATIDIEREVKTVHNVAAYLPGRDRRVRDHGRALRPSGAGRAILHGARSWPARSIPAPTTTPREPPGVIELARWFARQPKQKRGILFLTFAGEEMGLLGSEWYVAHPELPLDKAVAMINMDMIGRVRDGKLYIGGVATGDGFAPCWTASRQVSPEDGLFGSSGYGSSDHTSFTTKAVPVLFFFSGLHAIITSPATPGTRSTRPMPSRSCSWSRTWRRACGKSGSGRKFVRVAPSHGGRRPCERRRAADTVLISARFPISARASRA